MKKVCRICGIEKDLSKFESRKKGSKDGKFTACMQCRNKQKMPGRFWYKYGIKIDPGLFDRLYQEQDGRCALCGRHQSELEVTLCLDHNHSTGQIRGLLCQTCNRTLAWIELLEIDPCKIGDYLKQIAPSKGDYS